MKKQAHTHKKPLEHIGSYRSVTLNCLICGSVSFLVMFYIMAETVTLTFFLLISGPYEH